MPNSRLGPPPGRRVGWRGGIPGSLGRRGRAPHPEGAWGGRASAPLAPAPVGGRWSGLAQTGRARVLRPPLRFPSLLPTLSRCTTYARKRSRKKRAENFLMRKGITSGGRREPEYYAWGSPSLLQERKLWGRETRDSTGLRPTGIPSCLPGPPGAWVGASWMGDSAVQEPCASCWNSFPRLIQRKAQEFGVSDTGAFGLSSP